MPYDIFKDLRAAFDRQLVARSSGGRAATRRSRPTRSSSPTAKPIPASSISPPPASAPRRISPPKCGSCAPASTPCTCPTRASAPPITDMMSNKVQMAFSSIAGALPFTSDGRVIPLATTGSTRSRGLSRSADGRGGGPARLRRRSLARPLRHRPARRPPCWKSSTPPSTRRCRTRRAQDVVRQIRPDAARHQRSPTARPSPSPNTRNGRRSSTTATSRSIDA